MHFELFELMVRVLCDNWEDKTFDAVFLVSQTEDNESSILIRGEEL